MIFSTKICSLKTVRKTDISFFDGIITIEGKITENPFRVKTKHPDQLVLKFDDISEPTQGFIEPQEIHVKRALAFADSIKGGSLLIHCHAGISRSTAIALAIFAQELGAGKEIEAVKILEQTRECAKPNRSLVQITDHLLGRNMKLYKAANKRLGLTERWFN